MHDASDARREVQNELERIEEDCTHTGKSHFNAAARWNSYHYWIGIPAVLVGGLSTVAFFKNDPVIGGLLAALFTGLTAVQTFLKPSERGANHKAAGDQYLALKNDARVFRRVKLWTVDSPAAVSALDELSGRRNELNIGSPPFSDRDRRKARASIEKGEAVYRVDTV